MCGMLQPQRLTAENGFGTVVQMRVMSYAAILAAMCCPLDAYGAGRERFIPDCAGAVAIAHARVLRVERDGTLILSDGSGAVLEGVRLPPVSEKTVYDLALRTLRGAALTGTVNLTTTAPAKDRYGRLRVQGFGQVWLQSALLEQGLAQAQISPDRNECAPDLYEAEAQARSRHAGIWALARYRVRTPQALKDAAGTFQLVEGSVSNIGQADGRTFIDFGDKRLFSVVIGATDRRAFREFDFEDLRGRQIRVRGIVQDYRGRPEIVLSHPAQIELLY
jgi:hypothetical protein